MDDEHLLFKIPKRLNEPMKILFWDFDVVLVFSIGVMFGILTSYMMMGLFLGMFFAGAWQKTKSGKSKGFAIHWLYWEIGLSPFRRTPKSAKRDFLG